MATLKQEYDTLRTEYQICKRKLDSKCEALLILSQDVDRCRQERDQFKLMAEQVQQRYQALKRQLAGVGPRSTSFAGIEYSEMKQQSLAQLLCEMREVNKSLQFEVDDFKQKLNDAQGDIKLLREQLARQRVGTTDEGMNPRHFPAHEREDLVQQLESSRQQYIQIERDLQQVLDEKEEQVTERDVYKTKYERLNHELNYILKGDENRIVDIDALSMDNKYLQERLRQMEEEKSMAMATVSKYKSILERKKNKGILKLGQSRSGGVVITQKQVQQLLQSKSIQTPTPQTMADLQSLAGALLDTVSDKNLALSHQRKTNKILGNRVAELEKKLKTLEVAGLWNVSGVDKNASLDKLRLECEEIKTLLPRMSDDSEHSVDLLDDTGSEVTTPLMTSPTVTPVHQKGTPSRLQNAGLSLEDLDLLPTKEAARSSPLTGDLQPSSTVVTPVLSPSTTAFSPQPQQKQTRFHDQTDFSLDDSTTEELQKILDVATSRFAGQKPAAALYDQDKSHDDESHDQSHDDDDDESHDMSHDDHSEEEGVEPSSDTPRCTSPFSDSEDPNLEDYARNENV